MADILTRAEGNLASLGEELEDVNLLFASYGVEGPALARHALERAEDQITRIARKGKEVSLPAEMAAFYASAVLLGLALSRELDAAHTGSPTDDGGSDE